MSWSTLDSRPPTHDVRCCRCGANLGDGEPCNCHLPPSILDEAARITAADRQQLYGHAAENHAACALAWTGYLRQRGLLAGDAELTAVDVCWLMILLKAIRAGRSPDARDHQVDVAGYARNIEMILTRP